MPTIISMTEHDNLVGRPGIQNPVPDAEGNKPWSYEFKYRASAQKALERLLANGVNARLED